MVGLSEVDVENSAQVRLHGVLLIHGIGQQRKGELLHDVVQGIKKYLDSRKAGADVQANVPPPTVDQAAEAVLTFVSAGNNEAVLFREVWWDQAHYGPKYWEVVVWFYRRGLVGLLRMIWGLLLQKGDDRATNVSGEPKFPDPIVAKFGHFARLPDKVKLRLGQWVKTSPPFLDTLWLLVVLFGAAVFSLVVFFASALLMPFYRVALLVPLLDRPAILMDRFVIGVLGDVQVYFENEFWASNVRRVAEELLLGLVRDSRITDITVVGHSLGALIAYDCLSKGRIVETLLTKQPEYRDKRITLVTVGGALNRIRDVGRRGSLRPISGQVKTSSFHWIDLYSRLDIVPAGELHADIAKASGCTDRLTTVRVENSAIPVRDHSLYWSNDVLVSPRLLRAILGWANTSNQLCLADPKKVTSRYAKTVCLGLVAYVAILAIGQVIKHFVW